MLSKISIRRGQKVLDLGCGYGPVGVFAATQTEPGLVHMSDVDALSIAFARRNAALNGVGGVSISQSDGFKGTFETGFDLILCNPPYHVDFSVPKHLIEKGFNRLTVGGSIFMVAKRDNWYRKKLTSIFGGMKVSSVDGYFVFQATRKSTTYANK